MPREGGMGDQPRALMDVFMVLDAVYEKMKAIELRKKAQQNGQ